jgi:hypothetical protein
MYVLPVSGTDIFMDVIKPVASASRSAYVLTPAAKQAWGANSTSNPPQPIMVVKEDYDSLNTVGISTLGFGPIGFLRDVYHLPAGASLRLVHRHISGSSYPYHTTLSGLIILEDLS